MYNSLVHYSFKIKPLPRNKKQQIRIYHPVRHLRWYISGKKIDFFYKFIIIKVYYSPVTLVHLNKQKKGTIFGTAEWNDEFVACASLLHFTLLCQDLACALHFPLYYTFYNYGFENGTALINSLLPYLVGIYNNEVFSFYLRLLLFCCYSSSNKIPKVHPIHSDKIS